MPRGPRIARPGRPLEAGSRPGPVRRGGVRSRPMRRCWADSTSLKTMAGAARLAGALGDLGPQAHSGEGRLDRVRGPQVDPALGGEVEERQQFFLVIGDRLTTLGYFAPYCLANAATTLAARSLSSALQISLDRALGRGLGRLRQRIEDVRRLVHPAPSTAGGRSRSTPRSTRSRSRAPRRRRPRRGPACPGRHSPAVVPPMPRTTRGSRRSSRSVLWCRRPARRPRPGQRPSPLPGVCADEHRRPRRRRSPWRTDRGP